MGRIYPPGGVRPDVPQPAGRLQAASTRRSPLRTALALADPLVEASTPEGLASRGFHPVAPARLLFTCCHCASPDLPGAVHQQRRRWPACCDRASFRPIDPQYFGQLPGDSLPCQLRQSCNNDHLAREVGGRCAGDWRDPVRAPWVLVSMDAAVGEPWAHPGVVIAGVKAFLIPDQPPTPMSFDY